MPPNFFKKVNRVEATEIKILNEMKKVAKELIKLVDEEIKINKEEIKRIRRGGYDKRVLLLEMRKTNNIGNRIAALTNLYNEYIAILRRENRL